MKKSPHVNKEVPAGCLARLWFQIGKLMVPVTVICHESFSFKVKLNFGPAPEAEDQVNETKGNDDLGSRSDGQH